ncbi:uncharacterized protein LOC101848490 [Aplysia californica]|uniref:Uncharacterized protein LOC101848490 n=1 Tax=Aplysia californica TaxID=6500 RepID=A0ABM0KAJ9_APLCA|nr:uncharacterized protein LOC101848490 [Aplysia californica]
MEDSDAPTHTRHKSTADQKRECDVTTADIAADNEDGYMGRKRMIRDERNAEKKDGKGEADRGGKMGEEEEDEDEDEINAELLQDGLKRALSQTWHAPDGGWGWVVVVSALMASLIVDGVTYTFGLFLGELQRAFQAPKSTIALASSMQVGIYLMVGPLVSALTNRFGCRLVIIVGSVVAGGAFMVSAFSPNVTVLILTYGVVGGIGFGMMYLPAIVSVSLYFESRRALATGIAVCGSGIGTFVLAPVTELLLLHYNWSWTLMILGAIILNGAVFGGLVRPLDMTPESSEGEKIAGEVVSKILKGNCEIDIDGVDRVIYTNETEKEQVNNSLLKPVKQKRKRKISNSSGGKPAFETIPLITITDDQENTTVMFSDSCQTVKPGAKNKKDGRFFSSTPNMIINSTSNLQHVTWGTTSGNKKDKTSSNSSVNNAPPRQRSNTVDFYNRVSRADASFIKPNATPPLQQRRKSHAPMGLAYISLSDIHINKIRDDINIPLSRRDIQMSGSLAGPEWDYSHYQGVKNQELYIQSIRSIASKCSKDGDADFGQRRTGLFRCLPESARDTLDEMLNLSILKDSRYWYILLGNFFCMIGFYVPFMYIPERAKLLGISENEAAFLLSIIGITNTVSRVLTGVVINFFNMDCLVVNNIALFLSGVVTIVCPLCQNYVGLAVVSAIFGVCVAAYISLCSILLCELLGVQNLTNAFGFVILFRGVACIIGPPIAGALIDSLGVFDPAFFLGGGFIVLGAISHIMLHLPCADRHRRRL